MEYVTIPSTKFAEVIQHLRHYYTDEPLNASVGLWVRGEPCEVSECYDLRTMQDGLSIMAIDKATGKIAGVALNGIARRSDLEQSWEDMKSTDNVKLYQMLYLLNNVNNSIDLFSKYNVDEVFELRAMAVDSRFRRRGIAKELFRRSELLAQKHGFKVMKADSTSFFTQKVAECQGWSVEKSVKYSDYKNENGHNIYHTESPHDYYKVITKLID